MEEETLRSPFLEKEQEDGGEIRDGPLIESRPNDLSLDAHLIMNPKQLARESWIESKKMWDILGHVSCHSGIWVPLN